MINNFALYFYSPSNYYWYWIGLYKEAPRPLEKTGWLWVDGTQYNDSLDLWDSGEPTGGAARKCGFLWRRNKWRDAPCRWPQRFICKKHSKWIHWILLCSVC